MSGLTTEEAKSSDEESTEKIIDQFTQILSSASNGFDIISNLFKNLPEEQKHLQDPRIETLVKKAIIIYLSEFTPKSGRYYMMYNNIRHFYKELFHYSSAIIDHEVIEAAKTGMNNSIQKLVDTNDAINFTSLVFWISQYQEEFNVEPRELATEEQQKIVPLLKEVAESGNYAIIEKFFDLFQIYDADIDDEVIPSPKPEKENAKEKLEETLFKNREKMCRAAAQLDSLASEQTPEEFANSLKIMEVSTLYSAPEETKKTILEFGKKYLQTRERAKKLYDGLLEKFGLTIADSEDLGKIYFREITIINSQGKIKMYQQETMLVMEFSDEDDYNCFIDCKFRTKSIAVPSNGRQCDARSFTYDDKDTEVSVVLINPKLPENKKVIFEHERHHALDEMFDVQKLERKNESSKKRHLLDQQQFEEYGAQATLIRATNELNQSNVAREMDLVGIKKEIMAYLVDGRAPDIIPAILSSPTYKHLFKYLKSHQEEYGDFMKHLEKICKLLSELIFDDEDEPNAEKILAYYIKDVPFYRLLPYLERLKKYRKKLNADKFYFEN